MANSTGFRHYFILILASAISLLSLMKMLDPIQRPMPEVKHSTEVLPLSLYRFIYPKK
jgi:hypothetical protein